MQLYDPKKLGAPGSGVFQPKEKKRLIVMIVVAVVIVGALVGIKLQGNQRDVARMAELGQTHEDQLDTVFDPPKIDIAALEAAASDDRPEQRVVLPAEALEAGFAASSKVYDGAFAAMGGRVLTAEIAEQIVQTPAQERGKLLRVRCFVDEMSTLPNPADPDNPRHFIRGHLEDGAIVFLAAQEFVGLAPVPDDFVRLDGLFVRVQRQQIDGEWRDAPLFVGPRMYESYPTLAPVKQLDPDTFAFVNDDSIASGIEGLDQESYWKLVSFVKYLEPGTVDWDSAPILDNKTITEIFSDGSAWRGKPVRVPVARMLDLWKQVQPENPLRLDYMVEGWFGRGDWLGQAKVARFVAPFDEVPPDVRKDVVVRAFFYKNLAYTPKLGGAAIAPFFVVQSLDKFVPPDNVGLRQMTYIVAGSLTILGIGVFVLLRRDRKSSEQLEAELLRRRRERREKLAPAAKS